MVRLYLQHCGVVCISQIRNLRHREAQSLTCPRLPTSGNEAVRTEIQFCLAPETRGLTIPPHCPAAGSVGLVLALTGAAGQDNSGRAPDPALLSCSAFRSCRQREALGVQGWAEAVWVCAPGVHEQQGPPDPPGDGAHTHWPFARLRITDSH